MAKLESAKAESLAALRTAQRDLRDAGIQAGRALFDAVAAEYLPVDKSPDVYSERLTRVVLPFVFGSLPIQGHDHVVKAAIVSATAEWDTRHTKARPRLATGETHEEATQVIERCRRTKGWTLEQLAAQAGLDIKQVYRIKQGKPVTTTTIRKLAGALGCDPGDLIGMTSPLKSQR